MATGSDTGGGWRRGSESMVGALRRAAPPIDRTLFESRIAWAGAFRLPLSVQNFQVTGPTSGPLVVFPRTAVWIEQAGRKRFVADQGVATIYNNRQEYRRLPISPRGDESDWWSVSPALAFEIARQIDPSAEDRAEAPFRHDHCPSSGVTYWRQRRLFERIRRGRVAPLEVEEEIVAIFAQTLRQAYEIRGHSPRSPRLSRASAEARRDLAAAARAALAEDLGQAVTLERLASRVGSSPFHLCRVFRAEVGETLHQHHLRLRVRASLERVLEGDPLTDIALDLGFSSHSHFTALFRREFGRPPRDLRRDVS